MKKLKKILMLFLLVLVIIVLLINKLIQPKSSKNLLNKFQGLEKVWSHRGLRSTTIKENTIKSVQNAINNGFHGVEIDIFFETKKNKFIVQHDKVQNKQKKSLFLENIFRALNQEKQQCYFWLDFKNLKKLNSKEIAQAKEHLYSLIKKYKLAYKLFVESRNPINLYQFKGSMPIYTLYLPSINPKSFLYQIQKAYLKLILRIFNNNEKGEIDGISLNYSRYDEKIAKDFSQFPFFLWTTNDTKKINELIQHKQISIILTDQSLP